MDDRGSLLKHQRTVGPFVQSAAFGKALIFGDVVQGLFDGAGLYQLDANGF